MMHVFTAKQSFVVSHAIMLCLSFVLQPILQSGRITFVPPLPLAKERATRSVRVANAVKVSASKGGMK